MKENTGNIRSCLNNLKDEIDPADWYSPEIVAILEKLGVSIDLIPHLINTAKDRYPTAISYNFETKCTITKINNVLNSINDEPSAVFDDKTLIWHRYGLIHRDDPSKPAIKHANGLRQWFNFGELIKTE